MEFPQYYYVNGFKICSSLFLLTTATLSGSWTSHAAVAYLAVYCSYTTLWVGFKHRYYADKQWFEKAPLISLIVVWAFLTPFMIAPYLMLRRKAELPAVLLFPILVFYVYGVVLTNVSDAQKFVLLQVRSGHLITESVHKLVRNPNYLGEVMIYFVFSAWPAMSLRSFWPLAPLLGHMVLLLGMIQKKEKSIARYKEWPQYAAKTAKLIPGVW